MLENKKPKYLYHLTDENSAENILKYGLKPMIGDRSKIVDETEKAIYLSDYASVPYWKLLLDRKTILRIDTSGITDLCNDFQYSYYKEYIYKNTIQPEYIKESKDNRKLTQKQMIDLSLSLIDSISQLCVMFARYVSYKNKRPMYDKNYYDYMITFIASLQFMLPHIDYSVLTPQMLRNYLKKEGENGETTLCDFYEYDTNVFNKNTPRLWQLLDTHELADENTKWIYNWLKTTFPRRLRVNTGGWTG